MSNYLSRQSAQDHVGLRRQIALSYLRPDSPLPLVIKPAVQDLSLVQWAAANTAFIDRYLSRNGAILFRDFGLSTVTEFEELIKAASGSLRKPSHRSTPRGVTNDAMCPATHYPTHQPVPMHHETSDSLSWPLKVWFFSLQVATLGGETPIADSRKIYNAIPTEIRDCFTRKRLLYVRNYGLDIPWQDAFQTSSRAVVENYCRESMVEFQWLPSDRLQTRQRRQAVERHPDTGEIVWFNQAHLFHISRLPAENRASLLSAFGEQYLPRNVYFADGSSIDSEMIDEISRAYETQSVVFPWRNGDVLLLDNMLTAHGRNPFAGKREVVVRMGESYLSNRAEQSHAQPYESLISG